MNDSERRRKEEKQVASRIFFEGNRVVYHLTLHHGKAGWGVRVARLKNRVSRSFLGKAICCKKKSSLQESHSLLQPTLSCFSLWVGQQGPVDEMQRDTGN